MNLKLLSWNVRGLNNPHKRDTMKNLLKEWKCEVVFSRNQIGLYQLLYFEKSLEQSFCRLSSFGCCSHSKGCSLDLGQKGV